MIVPGQRLGGSGLGRNRGPGTQRPLRGGSLQLRDSVFGDHLGQCRIQHDHSSRKVSCHKSSCHKDPCQATRAVSIRQSYGEASSERMRAMPYVAPALALLPLFADAPNPALCPHHHCSYHHATSGGIAVVLVVVIVVLVLLVVLAIALLRRHRRRRRRG